MFTKLLLLICFLLDKYPQYNQKCFFLVSLVNIELDREQIATKGFIVFLCSTMHIKQHTKSLPKLKHHKGSNYDAEEMIVHAKM